MQKKVAKFPILGINTDDSDFSLPAGFHRSIRNAIPNKGGLSKAGGIQNVPGTLARTNTSLPSGTNTCIGAFEDRANNRIVYFIHNSTNLHGVWYFSPNSNSHTLLIQGAGLNFSLSYQINSCDFIEDIITWTDGYNEPRMITVTSAIAGLYNGAIDQLTSLQKFNPFTPPTTTFSASGSGVNNLVADSRQFSYRLIYTDNTVSLFSPLSKLVLADLYQDPLNTNNIINVTATIPSAVIPVVSRLQFAFCKNNDGNYFIFKELNSGIAASNTVTFTNTEPQFSVDPADLLKNNLIPPVSKNVIISGQRVVTTLDVYDRNFEDIGNSILFITPAAWDGSDDRIHAPGEYTYGIVYFDSRMRSPGVVKKSTVTINNQNASSVVPPLPTSGVPAGAQMWVSWGLGGNPPSWAAYYAFVRKKNNTISSVFQVPSVVLFYKRELVTADTLAAGEFRDGDKIYYNSKSSVPGITAYTGQLYFKIPLNLPVAIDTSYRVRIIPSIGQTKTEPIIAIQGDKIITNNFGKLNWSTTDADNSYPVIQIEKINPVDDDLFYEIGEVYSISGGVHSVTTGTFKGDHYARNFDKFIWQPYDDGTLAYAYTSKKDLPGRDRLISVLTQSPTAAAVTYQSVKTESWTESTVKDNYDLGRVLLGTQDAKEQKQTSVASLKNSYTFDYSKIASDNGRSWIEVKNRKTNYEPSTLSISDKYVLNSKINGLNRFQNIYSLPPNRSPVRKLVNIGSSGIFLAIHERSVTSIAPYSGDKFAPNSDGTRVQDALASQSIIAWDNELGGGYGTIYPESVVEHGGKVYWFDPYKGEVCRYAANGVTPIGSIYKMRTFFSEKGSQFINTAGRHVYGGFDPNLNMYILTFSSEDSSENETICFIDKQGEERWISYADYIVERYAKINNRLFSFASGSFHEHGAGTVYNNFHGVQYKTELTVLFNSEFSHEKILRNISTESTTPWLIPSILVEKNVGSDQLTNLFKTDFVRRDDVWYGDVMRDKNTFGLTAAQGRVRGQIMIGKSYEIGMENDDTELSSLQFVNFGYQQSAGHKIV